MGGPFGKKMSSVTIIPPENHIVLCRPFDCKQVQHKPTIRKAITMSYSAPASASWWETPNDRANMGNQDSGDTRRVVTEVESTEAAGLIYECDIGANDIVLGEEYKDRSGRVGRTMLKWSRKYVDSEREEKRGIALQVVDDLRGQGFRFLSKAVKGDGVVYYTEAKKDCEKEKVLQRVMRQLRKMENNIQNTTFHDQPANGIETALPPGSHFQANGINKEPKLCSRKV
jgi:hypothetical protein